MEANPKKSSRFGDLLRQHHGGTPHELPGPLRELLEKLELPATPSHESTMNKSPPVAPAQRSHKGAGSGPDADAAHPSGVPENVVEQDRQGNIRQHTTNQGYQQDR
jgi:hypothetical protein